MFAIFAAVGLERTYTFQFTENGRLPKGARRVSQQAPVALRGGSTILGGSSMSRALKLLSLVGALVVAACSNNPNSDAPLSRDEALQAATKTTGPSTVNCTSIGYDSDADGINDVFAVVSGYDVDSDLYPAPPTSWTNIYEGSVYVCGFDVPIGYVEIADDTEVGTDCAPTDPLLGAADLSVYTDLDGDGYGNDVTLSLSCGLGEGMVTTAGDCDDTDATVHTDAVEVCNGIDDNCSGVIDEGALDAGTWYADDDGDGYGDFYASVGACDAPLGYSAFDTDCDDADPNVHPGMAEVCDGIDQDCQFGPDDGLAYTDYYVDGDLDGFGSGAVMPMCADPGMGHSLTSDDCNDADGSVFPGAGEVMNDGIDQDCSGADLLSDPDPDADGDGFPASTDCNDGDASINPGMSEMTGNGIDDDCNAATSDVAADPDADGDGFPASTDCNDGDSNVNPGMSEVAGNGTDDDCNGGVEVPGDGIDNDNNGVADGEPLCFTGTSAVGATDVYEIYLVNYSVTWDSLPATGDSGSVRVCTTFDQVGEDEYKVNANVNGGSYWFLEVTESAHPNHLGVLEIGAASYAIGGVDPGDSVWVMTDGLNWMLLPWSYTGSAPWAGRDLVFTAPVPPTE